MTSGYLVTANYPRTNGAFFDIDYYIQKHLPLALDAWTPHGVKIVAISRVDDSSSPYQCQCVMLWPSAEAWRNARTSPESNKVWEDVPKYTDLDIVIVEGERIL